MHIPSIGWSLHANSVNPSPYKGKNKMGQAIFLSIIDDDLWIILSLKVSTILASVESAYLYSHKGLFSTQ